LQVGAGPLPAAVPDAAERPPARGGGQARPEPERLRRDLETSRRFGEPHFDGPRHRGYGGHRYDGRGLPVAKAIVTLLAAHGLDLATLSARPGLA
jgi:hypothetical protein